MADFEGSHLHHVGRSGGHRNLTEAGPGGKQNERSGGACHESGE
jgi:hypothetical protein